MSGTPQDRAGDYTPIACSLHDRFESAAVRGVPVTLTWSGSDTPFVGRIVDVRVQDGAEFLVLEDGQRVRLDHIETFDDGA